MRQIADQMRCALCLTVGRADINGNVNALALHVAGDGCFVIAVHCAAAAATVSRSTSGRGQRARRIYPPP